jgi:transcriptional regulator with XRE-family HTH domain
MISRALKMLRRYHDLKQKDLAAKLGLSPSHLCEIEAGTKPVSYDLLEKYSEVFEIPVSSITIFAEVAGGKACEKVTSALAGRALRFLEWMENISKFRGEHD